MDGLENIRIYARNLVSCRPSKSNGDMCIDILDMQTRDVGDAASRFRDEQVALNATHNIDENLHTTQTTNYT